MSALVPVARIARVSWWRRLRAWWRTRRPDIGRVYRHSLPSPMGAEAHAALVRALKAQRDRIEAQLLEARITGRVSILGLPDRPRPEPTTMPGPGERSPR